MIGLDGVAVVVSRTSGIFRDGVPVMTLGELNLLWSRESEGLITRWSQISPRFADAPIVLSGAASTSGTFDVFTAIVCGKEGDSRTDYFGTEEDQLLAEQTGADPYGLTYFGFAFLDHNRDRVQAVGIDPRPEVIDPPRRFLPRSTPAALRSGRSRSWPRARPRRVSSPRSTQSLTSATRSAGRCSSTSTPRRRHGRLCSSS